MTEKPHLLKAASGSRKWAAICHSREALGDCQPACRIGDDGGISRVAGRSGRGADHRARGRGRSRLAAGRPRRGRRACRARGSSSLGSARCSIACRSIWLQFAIGILLLLFGMRWLRKAILRAAGLIPLHDEASAFASETAELREQARRDAQRQLDWLAGLASFKAVLLEGLEVVFIVIAVSAGRGVLIPVSAAALAACLLVALVGLVVHRPLGAGAGECAEIRRRRDAVGLRPVLDRRGLWRRFGRARISLSSASSRCSSAPGSRLLRSSTVVRRLPCHERCLVAIASRARRTLRRRRRAGGRHRRGRRACRNCGCARCRPLHC